MVGECWRNMEEQTASRRAASEMIRLAISRLNDAKESAVVLGLSLLPAVEEAILVAEKDTEAVSRAELQIAEIYILLHWLLTVIHQSGVTILKRKINVIERRRSHFDNSVRFLRSMEPQRVSSRRRGMTAGLAGRHFSLCCLKMQRQRSGAFRRWRRSYRRRPRRGSSWNRRRGVAWLCEPQPLQQRKRLPRRLAMMTSPSGDSYVLNTHFCLSRTLCMALHNQYDLTNAREKDRKYRKYRAVAGGNELLITLLRSLLSFFGSNLF